MGSRGKKHPSHRAGETTPPRVLRLGLGGGGGLKRKRKEISSNQNPKKEIPNPKNKERKEKERNLHGFLTHCHVGCHGGAGKQYPPPPRQRVG
jgi:hypothetical protein